MTSASAIPAGAKQVAHEVAPWIARLAKLGLLAKELLYITVGALATAAALRLAGAPAPVEGKTVGSRGAMSTLVAAPLGRVLLVIIAIGLFGFGAWKLLEAMLPQRRGHDAKAIVMRVRSAGVGLLHVALGYSAVRIAMGHYGAAAEGSQSRHWTARALATPGGVFVLYAIAIGLASWGIYQLYCAARARVGDELSLETLSARGRRWVLGISRFGIAARGAIFVVAAGLLVNVARHRDPSQTPGEARSLRKVFELGTLPFALIAVGVMAYGIYQLLSARYQRIQVA